VAALRVHANGIWTPYAPFIGLAGFLGLKTKTPRVLLGTEPVLHLVDAVIPSRGLKHPHTATPPDQFVLGESLSIAEDATASGQEERKSQPLGRSTMQVCLWVEFHEASKKDSHTNSCIRFELTQLVARNNIDRCPLAPYIPES
jgi:hypothetical protein